MPPVVGWDYGGGFTKKKSSVFVCFWGCRFDQQLLKLTRCEDAMKEMQYSSKNRLLFEILKCPGWDFLKAP